MGARLDQQTSLPPSNPPSSSLSDLILVSHAYIGGLYAEWWKVYEAALANKHVEWSTFDRWVGNVKVDARSFAKIPVSRVVKYDVPKPATPLEELELLPEFRGKTE